MKNSVPSSKFGEQIVVVDQWQQGNKGYIGETNKMGGGGGGANKMGGARELIWWQMRWATHERRNHWADLVARHTGIPTLQATGGFRFYREGPVGN